MVALDGKVAIITGAGRGQRRSHTVRLANDGAVIDAGIFELVEIDIGRETAGIGTRWDAPRDISRAALPVDGGTKAENG